VVNNTQYKSALNNKIFEVISQASQELNVDSYVIGGFVRDLLIETLKKTSTLPLAAELNWL
jgi:tRNA nucleotidyltransferase (CCA-adding enzyme)